MGRSRRTPPNGRNFKVLLISLLQDLKGCFQGKHFTELFSCFKISNVESIIGE